ncbi:MAG: trehalose-phosphatase [Caulobacteraceae bacterium]|nr:MAG: trehalose-phosphatase [Caulobacteraceae bacterium]
MNDLPDERLEVPFQAPPSLDLTRTALFLDLDGTLADIAETPGAVGPVASRTRTLRALSPALDGRLAILSGREVAEIDRILEGSVASVAGLHGLDRRTADGRLDATPPHPALPDARQCLASLAKAERGLLLEDKGTSVALHYRLRPEAGPAVVDCARRLARQTGLILQEGHMVAELRTPGPDKGEALQAFMAEAPFAGATPIMIGDDLTDEDAFAAAIALGGEAILIGLPRRSRSRWRLEDPSALLSWLEASMIAPVAA